MSFLSFHQQVGQAAPLPWFPLLCVSLSLSKQPTIHPSPFISPSIPLSIHSSTEDRGHGEETMQGRLQVRNDGATGREEERRRLLQRRECDLVLDWCISGEKRLWIRLHKPTKHTLMHMHAHVAAKIPMLIHYPESLRVRGDVRQVCSQSVSGWTQLTVLLLSGRRGCKSNTSTVISNNVMTLVIVTPAWLSGLDDCYFIKDIPGHVFKTRKQKYISSLWHQNLH